MYQTYYYNKKDILCIQEKENNFVKELVINQGKNSMCFRWVPSSGWPKESLTSASCWVGSQELSWPPWVRDLLCRTPTCGLHTEWEDMLGN